MRLMLCRLSGPSRTVRQKFLATRMPVPSGVVRIFGPLLTTLNQVKGPTASVQTFGVWECLGSQVFDEPLVKECL